MLASQKSNITENIDLIVNQYLATPLADGKTPAGRHLNRPLRTNIHLLIPPSLVTKENDHMPNSVRSFNIGDRVLSRNYSRHGKWRLATVEEKLGKLHYKVKLEVYP